MFSPFLQCVLNWTLVVSIGCCRGTIRGQGQGYITLCYKVPEEGHLWQIYCVACKCKQQIEIYWKRLVLRLIWDSSDQIYIYYNECMHIMQIIQKIGSNLHGESQTCFLNYCMHVFFFLVINLLHTEQNTTCI